MYSEKKNTRVRIRDLFVWCFVLAVMAAIAAGDVGQVLIEVGGGKNVNPAGGIGAGGTDASIGEPIQSFKLEEDLTIRDALAILGRMYQKNIVPSPAVDGVLAFRSLSNVTFEEAMDAILGGKFEYEQKGNIIEVFPTEDVSRMKYAVFALDYISAAEAQKLIMPILSGKGSVGVTTAALTGVPTGESIMGGTGGGDTMSLQDTIVVYDYAENIAKAEKLISSVDVRPKQVLIEATILSATLTEDTQFGIDWQTLKGPAITALTGIAQGSPDYLKSEGLQLGGATAITGGLTVGLAFGDIGTFIRAVEQITDVTILANPKILAVNKQLGQVYIGDKIGYNSQTTVAESGTSTSKVDFLDTGTKLSFRPYIGADGYIRMDIHAKNSAEKSGTVISETSTELVSNIMVKDGQTIVIGGLFQDTVENKRSQVPVLGDLPIVGGLFRGTADRNVRKEVMVLLAPHIIEEPSEIQGQARADDVNRKRFGAKEQMQWISRTRLAEDRYAKAAKYYTEGDSEAALEELKTVLELYPAYLEAIRLKERIIREADPDEAARMERIILRDIEQEEAENWMRR
ncbi:MAG: type II secretion system protein GspD [Planctomycetota bacterium]|jgi:type IV pilus assembly protein PilQ